MELLSSIAERSILLFGGIVFLIQILCYELGLRLGRRDRRSNSGQSETVGVVVGGMLGLLAFVLALTLSFANARFTERQAGSLAEANAIGTAWLRAKAIGGTHGETIAGLLEEYGKMRADFVRLGRDQEAIDRLSGRTSALQSRIWTELTAVVQEKPDAISSALMTALNETFDASTAERFAFRLQLPPQMFWLLMSMTFLSMACLGYQFGLREVPSRVLVALFILLWTSVVVDILDLASGRLGYLRTGSVAYDWTLQGFARGEKSPSLDELSTPTR